MTSLAAPDKLVPLTLPLGFIAVGVLELIAGAFLLALYPDALLAYRHPVLLAAAHLLLLGFGAGALMGAMHQLLPVILEVPLARPAWSYPALALWALGTPLQVLGFLEAQSAWVALGGGLALLGIMLFALHMLFTYRQARRWNPVATALAWATAYLVLTPMLGMLQALTLRYGFYDPNRLAWHVVAGLVGIFLLSILGVGHKLVGMFTLSHGVEEKVLGLELWAVNLGLVGLAFGYWPGCALLAVGIGLALYDTYAILRHRNKRFFDVGVRHFMAGVGFLSLAWVALVLRRYELAGLWFVLGFVGLVVSGMLYKILPFLVWTHRYAPQVGRTPVPLLKDMLPERAAHLAGTLLGLGALLAPFAPLGRWCFALGTLPVAYALWEVYRR